LDDFLHQWLFDFLIRIIIKSGIFDIHHRYNVLQGFIDANGDALLMPWYGNVFQKRSRKEKHNAGGGRGEDHNAEGTGTEVP
jgi:hypothetical protein